MRCVSAMLIGPSPGLTPIFYGPRRAASSSQYRLVWKTHPRDLATGFAQQDIEETAGPLEDRAQRWRRSQASYIFIKMHGNSGGFAAVYYNDADLRDAAYQELLGRDQCYG